MPLPPVARGYARRGRDMHQKIGYGQTSGVGGRTLKAGSIQESLAQRWLYAAVQVNKCRNWPKETIRQIQI